MNKLISSFILLAIVGISPLYAVRIGDLEFRLIEETPSSHSHGYHEARISIKNHSDKEYQVRFELSPPQFYSENFIESLVKDVVVPKKATMITNFYSPPLISTETPINITINGERSTKSLPFTMGSYYYTGRGSGDSTVLLSQRLNRDSLSSTFRRAHIYSSASYLYRSNIEIKEWSTNWLAYTSYAGVMFHSADWKAMNQGTRNAIKQYVRSGGSVAVVGEFKLPDGAELSVANGHDYTLYQWGFGNWFVLKEVKGMNYRRDTCRKLNATWESASIPHSDQRLSSAHQSFKIFGDEVRINLKGIFILMVIFFVVVGPLNYFILYRKKRKILLIVTIPIISFIFCFFIAVYALWSEGIDVHAKMASLTILDEKNQEATTIGMLTYYSVLTPADGFHFDTSTEIIPINKNGRDGGSPKQMNISSHQHLSSGWISSRVPTNFSVRKNETRRERLNITESSDKKCKGLNGFGVQLEEVYYRDQKGNLFKSGSVNAGDAFEMMAISELYPTHETLHERLSRFYKNSYWDQFGDSEIKLFVGQLKKGMYLTITKESPFLEEGLEGIDHRDYQNIIIGSVGGF